MRNGWGFLLAWLVLGSAGVGGARLAFADPLRTLDDCYAAALKQSETVASQAGVIAQEEERLKQARGSLLPTVTGTASYLWQQTPSNNLSGTLFPSTQPLVKLSAAQPLFRGFREFAGLRLERNLVGAQGDAWRAAAVQLYKDVAAAFYQTVAIEHDLANLTGELALYGKRIQELEGRLRIGRSRLTEVLTVQSALASLQAQAATIGGQLSTSRETIRFLTGFGPEVALGDVEPMPSAPPPLQSFLDELGKRPDVTADQKRAAAADESVSVAKGTHLPNLDLLGNYYFVRQGSLKDVDWDVQLALVLPIFSGGVTQSQVRVAASQVSIAELTAQRTRRTAEQEIRGLYETLRNDQRSAQSYKDSVALAERNFSEQSREYRLGLVTNIDVLTALTTFQENRRSLDRTATSVKLDFARLEAAVARRPSPLPSPGTGS